MHDIAERAIHGDETIEELTAAFYGPHGPLTEAGWEVRDQQRQMSVQFARQIDRGARWLSRLGDERVPSDGSITMVEAPCGCHAKGQGILMYDGTIKRVEDVVVGDRLMGPDGQPRNVLGLARGEQEMYDVIPVKGGPWRVNRDHILTLVRTGTVSKSRLPRKRRDCKDGEVIDVRLSEFLSWGSWRRSLYKLFRVPVSNFGGMKSELPIPAYILGVLLGDGSISGGRNNTQITTFDLEIVNEAAAYAASIGLSLNTSEGKHYRFSGPIGIKKHPLRNRLASCGLLGTRSGDKFIPHMYLTSSRENRLDLLAGLIDTDGSLDLSSANCFDYISKSSRLANDVAFLARSLGMAAYVKPCRKSCQTGASGAYYRVMISGPCSEIPTRVPRKMAPVRRQKKDVLRTGFSLKPVGVEPYYGFELDGDGRFLLDDFTVTHNTGKGAAYLVPGILAALRAETIWWAQQRRIAAERAEKDGTAYREPSPDAKNHPYKLVVSTANIALQSQLIRKDIPAVAEMLGLNVRATLMKGRHNYVCRNELLQVSGKLVHQSNDDLQRLSREVLGDERHTGDREAFKWDVSRVWPMVSVMADDCLRDGCPHWDPNADVGGCWWRKVVASWANSHVIVANHHWAALSAGISAVGYAVDEAHELENAVRGVQGKTATSASFVSLAARLAPLMGEDRLVLEDMLVPIATRLFDTIDGYMVHILGDVEQASMDYKRPVPLAPDWTPTGFRKHAVSDLTALLGLRDAVVKLARGRTPTPEWRADGKLVVRIRSKDDEGKRTRGLVACANRLIDLCQLYAAVVKGRPHPAWPSSDTTWAIWAQRERQMLDGAERWRIVLNLTPADVAPFFAYLNTKYPVMMLTSATLPEFTSMRLSLGMGAKWEREPPLPWPAPLRTDVGALAGHEPGSKRPDEDGYSGAEGVDGTGGAPEPEPVPAEEDDEPQTRAVPKVGTLAPAPCFEGRLPSPYPLEQQGLLVIPRGPLPKDTTRWQAWAVEQVVNAVRASSGGALILATSNAMMQRYTNALREERRWNVYKQGEAGRQQVVESFKADTDSVLVGTRSFFQGLDVQGESCRLVVIDKVPFASPDDPLEQAVGDLLVQRAKATGAGGRDPNAYLLRTVPEAAMVLVQGVGRLIRSREDRGVVVLLDGRVLQPGKGWETILQALPPFPLSDDPRDILRHLNRVPTSARPIRARYDAHMFESVA